MSITLIGTDMIVRIFRALSERDRSPVIVLLMTMTAVVVHLGRRHLIVTALAHRLVVV